MRKLKYAFFFALLAMCSRSAEVAVAAREKGYYTSIARHLERWLGEQSVKTDFIEAGSGGLAKRLAGKKMVFLVGYDSPSAAELDAIEKAKKTGTKFTVFYSASPRLASLMGVKCAGYRKANYPGQFSRMVFSSSGIEGVPPAIRQTSTVLQSAVPLAGRGRTIATWADRKGKSTGEAAVIATDAGFWITHVFLADGDEDLKAQLSAAFVGSVAPQVWSWRKAQERLLADHKKTRALALRQIPRKGEIHAVWDHSGCGLYPGNWPKTMKVLQEARVTDLFVNVAGAGFAHYPSNVLPRSKTYAEEGDQLKACLAAAKETGIRVHAWILCFTATRSTPDRLKKFASQGFLLKDRTTGRDSEYLDPSNPAVREYILSAISEIQSKYPVDGIHLDFVRWYEKAAKPKDAAEIVTRFVADARKRVRRPKWLTAAVLGKYPACVDSVGQDWVMWLDANRVDYVVPMDYTGDLAKFESFVAQHAATRTRAGKTIAGIGVTANESRLGPRSVIDEINIARRHNLAGVALFDLDVVLEKKILPYLKLGMW